MAKCHTYMYTHNNRYILKKKLIQVHANMFKNQFLPYIVHVKYTCTTLTVPDNI